MLVWCLDGKGLDDGVWCVIVVIICGGMVLVMIVVCELDVCVVDIIFVKFYYFGGGKVD